MQGALSTRVIALTAAVALLCAAFVAIQPRGETAGAAAQAETAKKKKKGKKYSIKRKGFTISQPNDGTRLVVGCPGKSEPLGGGMTTDAPDADGAGIYPHSFERLGRQSGYHISVVLYDRSAGNSAPKRVTLSVLCGPKFGKVSPPHVTRNLGPTGAGTMDARCPGRRFLLGGGYQRTNFTNQGGIYATESRALNGKVWRVSALGLGKFGGQATSIGYCVRTKKPPMKQVSATVPVAPRSFAAATTPRCPKGRRIAFGGYASPSDGSVLSTGGDFAGRKAWKVGGYNTSANQQGSITAYGYCAKL